MSVMKTTIEAGERQAISPDRRETATATTNHSVQPPIAIKSILVPIDFSRAAMQALDYATELARQFNAQVHLMHVQMPDETLAVPGAGHLRRECAESVTFLREKLGAIQPERPPQFWPENCHIRMGRAHREICELARELKVDLIVLASRGNSGLKRVFLGSTAERVVRFAPCPVLVVRQRKRRGGFPLGFLATKKTFSVRKILVPVDFSPCSMAGAIYAAFLARTFDAKLCLFHALQVPAPGVLDRVPTDFLNRDDLDLASARRDLEGFAELDFFHDLRCAKEIRTGNPVEQICAETRRPDVDLAVISTHGRTGFDRLLLGSVAEQVVRYAACPVLVVPSRCSMP
jgi:nucleotide-binding universal stress UspA family protein